MKPVRIGAVTRVVLDRLSRLGFRPQAFSLAEKLKEARSVLICMPSNLNLLATAKDFLTSFADVFEGRKISVLLPFLKTEGYLPSPAGYDVIYPQETDLKAFSIPGELFLHRVRQRGFDVSLDLDLEDGFFNRYLCFKCGVALRIGPQGRNAFPLYNVQLSIMLDRSDSRETYRVMANMLKDLLPPVCTAGSTAV
ncbi:MAG: hypothetical protein WCE90_01280 [Candidatus Zixiibacteriota bacterium]